MSEETYAIVVSPVATAPDLTYILNAYQGDPLGGPAMLGRLVAAGTGGQPPITHHMLGRTADAQWLADMQSATPPTPAGGWPLMDPNNPQTVLLTQANASIAWAARQVFTRTGQDVGALAAQTRAAMFSAMGLMLYDPGD